MKIIGIDPSLTALGLACITARPGEWSQVIGAETFRPKIKGKVTESGRQQRLAEIVLFVQSWITDADLVVIEGPAFDAHDTERQLAGLQWIIRRELWCWGLDYVVIPPSSLKRFVSSGVASKQTMLDAARAAFVGVEVEDDNAADALWLAEIGAARLGCPVLPSSPERVSHIRGATWPISDIAA